MVAPQVGWMMEALRIRPEAEALNPTQFRMQTNIKQKPGSQGTLFQGGYNRNYHRGYGPERRAAIQRTVDFDVPSPRRASETSQRAVRGAESERISRVVDNIARSTIPIRHLGNDDEGRPLQIQTAANVPEDVRGDYWNRGESGFGFPLIRLQRGVENSTTVIHEIGHHVSHLQGTEHARHYIGPDMRGQEEAYADNYAQKHWRDRRGKPAIVPEYAGGAHSETRPAEFYDSYRATREADQPYRDERPHEYNPWVNSTKQIPGQLPLLEKTGTGQYHDSHRHWDYTYEDQAKGIKRDTPGDPRSGYDKDVQIGQSAMQHQRSLWETSVRDQRRRNTGK